MTTFRTTLNIPGLPSSLDRLDKVGADTISMDEQSAMLESTAMLKDFEWKQIETLSGYFHLYRAPAGTVLFREGDRSDFMCLVLQGKVEVSKEDAHHDSKTVAVVAAGRSLGEMAMVDHEPRSATARVTEEALLAVLTQQGFAALTRDKPTLAVQLLLKVAQLISQRLRHASGVLVDYLEK